MADVYKPSRKTMEASGMFSDFLTVVQKMYGTKDAMLGLSIIYGATISIQHPDHQEEMREAEAYATVSFSKYFADQNKKG